MPNPWADGWNHSIQYHDRILQAVPTPCRRALDLGCGEGLLTRQLAPRCGTVLGIDLDPQMITTASSHPSSPANATFLLADVMTHPFPQANFDLVASVATLHHLPHEAALKRLKDLLTPGGTLAVIGLYRAHTLTDHALAAVAYPLSRALRLVRPWADMQAPVADPHQSLGQIRLAAGNHLPGSIVRRHLLFRFSLVWHKPLA